MSESRNRALQALVPEELIAAYSNEPIVHALFTRAAINQTDQRDALIEIVLALVEAKKQAVDVHLDHLRRCPGAAVLLPIDAVVGALKK